MKSSVFILTAGASVLLFGGQALAWPDDQDARGRMDPNRITNNDPANTSENVRDRDDRAVLPEDQSNKAPYLDRSAAIRRDITKTDNFSSAARNVKIVTMDDGTVVLRGPVNNQSEKSQIESIAQRHSGKDPVKSYIEIAK